MGKAKDEDENEDAPKGLGLASDIGREDGSTVFHDLS